MSRQPYPEMRGSHLAKVVELGRVRRELARQRRAKEAKARALQEQLSLCPLLALVKDEGPREQAEGQKETVMSKNIARNKMQTEPIYFIPVGQLKACKIQPKSRTGDRRRSGLQTNISEADQIYVPGVVVPFDDYMYTIADGHRRWESAKELGMETMPCRIVENGTAVETLFILLNADTAKVTGSDWLTGWAKANKRIRAELFELYPRRAKTIEKAIEVYGEDRLEELDKGNAVLTDGTELGSYDPSQAAYAVKVSAALEKKAGVSLPTLRQIGEALLLKSKAPRMPGGLRLAQEWLASTSSSHKHSCDKVATALRKGRFLERTW